MIRPRNLLLVSMALVPSLGCLYYWGYYATDVPYETLSDWMPDAVTIRREIGTPSGQTGSPQEQARRRLFIHLFQQRYRGHQPAVAVGLRFLNEHRIKLMCPARMEPWNIDHITQAAWNETRDNFGHSFDIDIYETYIGAAPVKIGELRPMPNRSDFAQIVYSYPSHSHTP